MSLAPALPSPAPTRGVVLKLSLIWFFGLGSFGVLFPFFSLFLRTEGGLRGGEIGLVMALPPLVSILSQGLWGQLADRTGQRSRVVALLAAGTAAGCILLTLPRGFGGFAAAAFFVAIFSSAFVPATMALTLAQVHEATGKLFGRVRVWGTVGFALTVGSFPWLLDHWQQWNGMLPAAATDTEPGLRLMFPLAAACVLLVIPFALTLPRSALSHVRAEPRQWRELFRNPRFLRLLLVMFLAYFCVQGPMALFPLLVLGQGGGLDALSGMWLLMLALEIPLIFFFGAGVVRAGPRGVIAIGLFASALRWIVSGFVDDLAVVAVFQLLHGVAVWGLILGAPLYVDLSVPAPLRSTAQGLLAMVGISAGGMLSIVSAGWLVEFYGPETPAQVGGIGIFLLALVLPWLLPRIEIERRHSARN